MSYYIFENDHVGHLLVSELLNASNRGIDVKLIIDATNNHLSHDILYTMLCGGIHIHIYNKFKLFRPERFVKYRMHDKIMLVDSKYAILGGRNIEDKYYGLSKKNFTDRDVFIEGDLSLQVRKYFMEIFNANVVEDVLYNVPVMDKKKQSQKYLTSAQRKTFGAEIFFNYLGFLKKDKISTWRYDFLEINNLEFIFDV